MTGTTRREQQPASRTGHAVGLLLSVALLWFVHQHPAWRPWLGGLVTTEFAEVVWVLDLSLGLQILGHAVLMTTWRRWLPPLVDVVNAAAAVLSVAVHYVVYPFDLSILAEGLDVGARVLLLLVLAATVIATFASLVRLLGLWVRPPAAPLGN